MSINGSISSFAQATRTGNITAFADASLFENCILTGEYALSTYGTRWVSQRFVPDITHTVSNIKIRIRRVGLPGTAVVGLYQTDASGHTDKTKELTHHTFDANIRSESFEWVNFPVASITVTTGVRYAILLRATSGNSANKLEWEDVTGSFGSYSAERTSDSGATWINLPSTSFLFELHDSTVGTIVTSSNHSLSNGNSVALSGTTNYNSTFSISSVTTNTYIISTAFVADDAAGLWTFNIVGQVLVTSNNHGLSNGAYPLIASTYYNGYFTISDVTTNTFIIETSYTGTSTGTWSIVTYVSLSGSGSGVGSATSSLKVDRKLTGSGDGVANATAFLTVGGEVLFSGIGAAHSSATCVIKVDRKLTGSGDGVANATIQELTFTFITNAGPDQIVEYKDREYIQLDGTASTGTHSTIYIWKLYGTQIAVGIYPGKIKLSLSGTYVITLFMYDDEGRSSYDNVTIVVSKKPLDLINLIPDKFKVA
jgi:hypothetical protein